MFVQIIRGQHDVECVRGILIAEFAANGFFVFVADIHSGRKAMTVAVAIDTVDCDATGKSQGQRATEPTFDF